MIPYCNFNGIGIIPWAPLAGGLLSRPTDIDPISARIDSAKGTPWEPKAKATEVIIISRVKELADKYNKSVAHIALAWVSAKIVSPIVGTSTVKRIEDNVVDEAFELTKDDMVYLEEAYVPRGVRGHA